MASEPPTSTKLTLPSWIWNGAVHGFIDVAELEVLADAGLRANEFRVKAIERGSKERPKLVTVRQLAGPPLREANYDPLHQTEMAEPVRRVDIDRLEARHRRLERVHNSAMKTTAAGLLAPGLAFHQLQTMVADPALAAEMVEAVVDDLGECRFKDTDERLYPNVGAYFIRFGGGMTVRIANAARRCWAVVGDRECDPRNDWLRALLRPVRSWSPAPARLEELA